MHWLDRFTIKSSRKIAQVTSRRNFLSRLGTYMVGGATIPLLPVARAQPVSENVTGQPHPPLESGDDRSCDYWRYCAIDGFLCSCCGGSTSSCPPGTEASPVTWIGTCRNPVDGQDYIISYNDCCGKSTCGRCLCNRNEGDRPVYRPAKSNDINWCLGTASNAYHCSTAVVLGRALE